MIIYGEEITILHIDAENGMALIRKKMLEIDGREMDIDIFIQSLPPEEQNEWRKELARNKGRVEKRNSVMVSGSTSGSRFGGYGGAREQVVPLKDVLTGKEKQALRNIHRTWRKNLTDDMKEHYHTTDMNEALAKFHARVKATPRILKVVGQSAAGSLQLELVKKK